MWGGPDPSPCRSARPSVSAPLGLALCSASGHRVVWDCCAELGYLAEEKRTGEIGRREGRHTEREEEELFCSLRASSLGCVPVCSSRVHARSRRLPSICPHRSLSPSLSWLPLLNLPYSLSLSYHFFFPTCPLSSVLNSLKSFCSLILMILPPSLSPLVSVSLWVMQRALAGFVCLTALQELLLAHRKHYFVDLLAGVRKGESGGGEQGKVEGGLRGERDETREAQEGETRGKKGQRRDEVAEGTACLREEDKGMRRVKYSLHKSSDTTLNYSKESRLLCMEFDAAPQQLRSDVVRRCSLV